MKLFGREQGLCLSALLQSATIGALPFPDISNLCGLRLVLVPEKVEKKKKK
jgi:hypothetical protein